MRGEINAAGVRGGFLNGSGCVAATAAALTRQATGGPTVRAPLRAVRVLVTSTACFDLDAQQQPSLHSASTAVALP